MSGRPVSGRETVSDSGSFWEFWEFHHQGWQPEDEIYSPKHFGAPSQGVFNPVTPPRVTGSIPVLTIVWARYRLFLGESLPCGSYGSLFCRRGSRHAGASVTPCWTNVDGEE